MGDIESSDDELHDIIAEYEEKAKENQLATVKQEPSNNNDESTTIKKEPPTKRIKKKKHIKKEKNLSVETPMDKVIFGDKRGLLRNLARAVGQEESSDEETKGKEKIRINEVEVNGGAKKRKPAWTDADDEEIQFGDIKRETRFTGPIDHIRKDKSYKEYLATRYSKIVPQPKWASLEKKKRAENSDDDDDGLLRTVGFLAKPAGDVLQPKHIYIKQLKDLNRATYCENGITGVQFHPTSTAALVTSHSGKASIYSIDGDANEKLHTVHFNKFSVLSARIMPCGTKAIFGSKQRYYYKYDLLTTKETYCSIARDLNCTSCRLEVSPCGRYMLMLGRFGEFHLFTTNSNEVLHTFKQDHKAIDVCFTSDSERIICKDDSANVNIFSLRQRRLQHSFIDDGCIKGNKLALSPDQRMLATGSMEGVVNVYDFEKVQHAKAPLPEKAFMNLRTEISALQFNHTSELLAMCSRKVPNAVKLAHFPSATVYENFPINNADMEHIQALQFSPHSGYLALGNNKRRVPLFRIKHFNNY